MGSRTIGLKLAYEKSDVIMFVKEVDKGYLQQYKFFISFENKKKNILLCEVGILIKQKNRNSGGIYYINNTWPSG